MENSTYVALSRAMALQRSIAVTANNVANVNTPGFKGEKSVFEGYVEAQGAGARDDVTFVLDRGSYIDMSPGGLQMTGNALDIAVQGDGWLGFQTPDGQIGLGRNGQLTMDADGRLVTAAGHQVLDAGGGPLALPADAGDVTIATDGTITNAQGDTFGRVGVFRGADAQSYERVPGGLFVPPGGGQPPLEPVLGARVVQGAVEGSNVDPVTEMARMIEMQRAFERSVTAMETEDKLTDEALQRLGRSAG